MKGKTRKASVLFATAALAVSLSTVWAHASPTASDSDDHYNPAGTTVKGTSTKTTFSVPATSPVITVTCTHSSAGGKTPATGLGAFTISPRPVFNDGKGKPCTDNLGGTETTTTSGTWKIQEIDAAGDESQSEPNSGDKLQVTVPKGGAVVHTSEGCTITVAPNGAFKVPGSYNDVNTFVVSISNLPIKVTGGAICPTTATTSSFNGTYTFSPHVGDAS